ncbi:MAG: dihydroorotate dehydrogenase electron transfer subunit [Pirellulaceae bacterium]
MTNPLHAGYYADDAMSRTVPVLENVEIAEATWRIRFAFPELAAGIVPGQFLMLRIHGLTDPLLGRAFALYETIDMNGSLHAVDVVYRIGGNLTRRLCQVLPGQRLDVWGPLGNGFSSPRVADHVIMVAGGIGQTPFLALGQELLGKRSYGRGLRESSRASRVTFCYGARRSSYLSDVEKFTAAGIDVRIATDDGSAGHHGLVTELLEQLLQDEGDHHSRRVVCCGPEPMMQATAAVARRYSVPCEVSLEAPMACGIGICFTCVAKVKDADGQWDYKRTCVEGPVFDAELIEW